MTSLPVPESAVLSSCIKWLWHHGCYVWRNNSGSTKNTYKRKDGSIGESHIRYGKRGSADIIGVTPNGRFIGVEAKSAKGKLDANQRAFGEEVVGRGGIYIVARSIDDLEARKREILT